MTQTGTQGECHVNMKAKMGVLHLQAKGLQRLPAMLESRNRFSLTGPGGASAAGILISDF